MATFDVHALTGPYVLDALPVTGGGQAAGALAT
jgi:hypothetical protein